MLERVLSADVRSWESGDIDDVRILFGTCSSYMGGDLLHITQSGETKSKDSKSKKTQGQASPPTKF